MVLTIFKKEDIHTICNTQDTHYNHFVSFLWPCINAPKNINRNTLVFIMSKAVFIATQNFNKPYERTQFFSNYANTWLDLLMTNG